MVAGRLAVLVAVLLGGSNTGSGENNSEGLHGIGVLCVLANALAWCLVKDGLEKNSRER